MSCRRSHEIDLLGFLEEPAVEQFDAFRTHYPRCADCSAEVRAWTELQRKLRGSELGHPDASLLLLFYGSRETLGGAQRVQVEDHIASCVECKDELKTLERFDFSALNETASEVKAAPRLSALADWLGRALWHPGLAYALVLILAIPLVTENWQSTREAPVAPSSAPTAQPVAKERDELPLADLRQMRRAERRLIESALKAEAIAMAPAHKEQLAMGEPIEIVAQLRALGYVDSAEITETAEDAFMAPPQAERQAMALRSRSEASFERTLDSKVATVKRARMVQQPLPTLPGRTLPARVNGDTLELRLPNPTGVEPGDELDVRIIRANGSRELGERLAAGANGFTLLEIPADWLGSGRHRVEVRISQDPPGAQRTLGYSFTAP